MMYAKEFAEKMKNIAMNYKTCYVWGGCGMPVTAQTVEDKLRQYPAENRGFCAQARALIGQDAWMFDCVCLIKSVLWGWKGNRSAYYGGAAYASNGVPDVSADGMIRLCKNVSADFRTLTAGEALWMPGHIGVYLGGGLAAECTPAWKGGVQLSAVGNLGPVGGYPARSWQKHGKLPWVNYAYEQTEAPGTAKNGSIIIDGVQKPINRILKDGYNYFKLRDLADACGETWPYEISNKGNIAVLTTKK